MKITDTAEYRSYICAHIPSGIAVRESTDSTVLLATSEADGQITFHDDLNLAEFQIVRKKDRETSFYLHFAINDEQRCVDLFNEFCRSLLEEKKQKNLNILLCCSSALTTSFFAEKLRAAAAALHLDYSFSAVPEESIYQEGFQYDMILLAPQVGYLLKKVRSALKDTPVLVIPTEIFGSYDSASCIRLIQDEMQSRQHTSSELAAYKILHTFTNDAVILTIVYTWNFRRTKILYRIYDHGIIIYRDYVLKPWQARGIEEFRDIIESAMQSCSRRIDAIGIAYIGMISDGKVSGISHYHDVDMRSMLEERYGIPVMIENNVNCAAMGWYAQQDRFQNIVFHSQPLGSLHGGQGIIVNGQLIRGFHSMAGEMVYTKYLGYPEEWGTFPQLWDPARTVELLGKVFTVDVGVIAPEVICCRSALAQDMSLIRAEMLKSVPEFAMPELIHIDDFESYIFIGIMILTLQDYHERRAEK